MMLKLASVNSSAKGQIYNLVYGNTVEEDSDENSDEDDDDADDDDGPYWY